MGRLLLKTLLTVSSLLLVNGKEVSSAPATKDKSKGNCDSGYYECFGSSDCIPNYFVCDGVTDCFYGDDENNCLYYSSTPNDRSTTTSSPILDCHEPFDAIGNRCVLVEPFTEMTWMEARYLCQKLHADLVVFDSVNFFIELLDYLNVTGLMTHHYWIGGTDEENEQDWKWINGDPIRRGTPFWAIYGSGYSYQQEPRDSYGSEADCAYLDKDRFFYIDDDDCNSQKATICQLSPWTLREQHLRNTSQESNKVLLEFMGMKSEGHASEGVSKNSGNKHRGTAVEGASDKLRKSNRETMPKRNKMARAKHSKKEKEVTKAQAENHHVHKVEDKHEHLLKLQAENQHA